jgi:secreted trypsin-like serine protease
MKPARCVTLALGLLMIMMHPVAQAIIVRHDKDAQAFLDLGLQFPCTVLLRHADSKDGLGDEGTLIAPTWVLTAAHVANELVAGDLVEVNHRAIKIRRLVIYPKWHHDADMPVDIALLQLEEPVTDVIPARLYTAGDEVGMVVTFVGRGATGTGLTGQQMEDGKLRAATNRVESTFDVFPMTSARGQYPAEGFQLRFRFDAPGDPNVTDLEGISGEGDSGGPAYIQRGGFLYIVGVSSGQDARPTEHKQGRYGVFEFYVRVSHFAGWIRSTMLH